jgi:hypothetical protein
MISSCGKAPRQEDIYGVWKGEFQGVELVFTFIQDGTCVLSFQDKATGSTDIINGNFVIDFSKNPIPLTVRNIPQLNHPLHTIVEFIEDNSMRIAYFAPRWRLRPITFGHNTSMILKRVDTDPHAKI